ncbi:MAG: DUF2304 domain-containing protein [Dactylosporangium sp.]|nr:DUF2304 domain-containing protein [Dactylosporangium sp.]NNJ62846.1 DUF2304 domain-containing protein [Dactylosporangium sp.]
MKLTIVTGLTGIAVLAFVLELLRRRKLQEKYAVLWLLVAVVIVPLAFFPRLLDTAAEQLGIASGVSLVLFLAIVFLLLVCMHLSWEVSRLEEEGRTLAEETALIRTEIRRILPNVDHGEDTP